jgi:hypothetical protein
MDRRFDKTRVCDRGCYFVGTIDRACGSNRCTNDRQHSNREKAKNSQKMEEVFISFATQQQTTRCSFGYTPCSH